MMHEWDDNEDARKIRCTLCSHPLFPPEAMKTEDGGEGYMTCTCHGQCPGPGSTDARADLGTTKEDSMASGNNTPQQPEEQMPDELELSSYRQTDSTIAQFAELNTDALRAEVLRRPLSQTLQFIDAIEVVRNEQMGRIRNGRELEDNLRGIVAGSVNAPDKPTAPVVDYPGRGAR